LLECIYDWTKNVDKRKNIDVIYIDFSKAFDTVCHNKLLIKLRAYGIQGNLLGWIKSFLYNRSQKVKIDSAISNSNSVISGVPQGSVLGPLLFLIYINDLIDLNQDESINFKLFADDLKLYTNVSDNCDKLRIQSLLSLIEEWTVAWQMSIAVEKCSVLHMGMKNPKLRYTLSTTELPDKSECKDLGIIVSDDLKFEKHISFIREKSLQRTYLLFRFSGLKTKSC
jgi:ribonucleases P/MRP protein subunit RPP40